MAKSKNNKTNHNFSFYDSAPIGICALKMTDENPHIIYANPSFLYLINTDRVTYGEDHPELTQENIIGNTLNILWPSTKISKIINAIKNGHLLSPIALPIRDIHENQPLVPIDGRPTQRWFRLSLSIQHSEGTPTYILWVTDISEEKYTEEMWSQMAHEAEKTMEIKSNFLASMSHEIRTPMQSIFGYLELIADTPLKTDVRSMVSSARASATGLLEILDDILDLAKVDAGKMELDLLEIPLRTLIYGVLECMEVKLQGKAVKLDAAIDENVPFVIIGDPTRLRQILLNLVGNALKFTDTGNITIAVHLKCEHIRAFGDDIGLRFEVIDSGIGMPQAVCDKLFQAFTQADSSTTRKYGGTGLGLSISQKLIDLMNGEIGVTSEEGKGSIFWFEFPTQTASLDITDAQYPDLDGLAILSVEDHPQGAREIASSLHHMGAEVISCPTFQEGLTVAQSRRFDVAVIDQGLPDGLGLDLMKELVKLHPQMGLIMYTVRDDLGLQHSVKSLGATFLTKPASRMGLGDAVKDSAKKHPPSLKIDGPVRLLIAEDTPAVQDVLKRQLKTLGVDADFVENGEQALEKLKKQEHAILFTDLHMPKMDGYATVNHIREQEAKNNIPQHDGFPVILLTADVQLAQKQAYLKHGFNECLLKPVSLGQFRQLLIRWGILTHQTSIDAPLCDISPSLKHPCAHLDVTDKNLPPAIDEEAMITQLGNLDENVIEMMHVFIEMTEPQINKLLTTFEEQNAQNLADEAHSLKGAARSACCMVLGDLADQLQDRAEGDTYPEPDLIKQIQHEFERVKVEVRNLSFTE